MFSLLTHEHCRLGLGEHGTICSQEDVLKTFQTLKVDDNPDAGLYRTRLSTDTIVLSDKNTVLLITN